MLQHLKDCVIFDIDGTLADGSHRQHLIKGPGKKNWPAYQRLAHDDKPIWPVINALKTYALRYPVFIVSGRGEHEREITQKWLHEEARVYENIDYKALYMRPNRDSRADTIIKEEILVNDIQKQGYWPIAVFDDRPRVVAMWKSKGIFVFNVQQVHDDF